MISNQASRQHPTAAGHRPDAGPFSMLNVCPVVNTGEAPGAVENAFGRGTAPSQDFFEAVFALRFGALVPMAATLRAIAAGAPAGVCPLAWALSAALVRGCILSARVPVLDRETELLVDGYLVTVGPYHAGPEWAVIDETGGVVWGAHGADDAALWLADALEHGAPTTEDGRLWSHTRPAFADAEAHRLAHLATHWPHVEEWLFWFRAGIDFTKEIRGLR